MCISNNEPVSAETFRRQHPGMFDAIRVAVREELELYCKAKSEKNYVTTVKIATDVDKIPITSDKTAHTKERRDERSEAFAYSSSELSNLINAGSSSSVRSLKSEISSSYDPSLGTRYSRLLARLAESEKFGKWAFRLNITSILLFLIDICILSLLILRKAGS